ncbi:MAG: hypothetical protein WCQ44_13425, partial [Opitutaceae bacterium]
HNIKDGKPTAAEPPTPQTSPTPPNPGDEPPAWAKAIIDQNKSLADKLQAIEGGKVTTERITKLRAELTGAPENLIGRFEKDMPKDMTDEQFTAWMAEVKTDVEPIITALVQRSVTFNPPAIGGAAKAEPEASPEVKARIADRETTTASEPAAIKGLPK